MKISVVIPSWNGAALLRRNLPAVLAACERYGDGEVVVCDDGSDDGTAERMARDFPAVRVVMRSVNGGFAKAANDGIHAASGKIVVCLNNDIRPEPDFLGHLVRALEREPDLLAAAPRILNQRFGGDEARTLAVFRRGFVDLVFPDREVHPLPERGPSPILYACGGAAAFRRERFLALGGFDASYHPFYWEDVDVGWRARRRGWGSVHVPASVVHHEGGATIGRRFPARLVKIAYERNRLFFLWSNLLDRDLWARHLAWLGPRLGYAALRGRPLVAALLRARPLLGRALRRRREERRAVQVSDRVILEEFRPTEKRS